MTVRRLVCVLAAAVLAICGLTACQTNTGAAAFVGDTKITESDVNKLLTVNAAPYTTTDPSTGQTSTVNPKSSAVNILIVTELAEAALLAHGGPATEAELASGKAEFLQQAGATEEAFIASYTEHGFSEAYGEAFIYFEQLLNTLLHRANTTDVSTVATELVKLNIPVSVSPRYGKWDPNQLGLADGPITPSFLNLSSAPAPSPSAAG